MFRLRSAERNDLPRLIDLVIRANEGPYPFAPVAEEKCLGDGYRGSPAATLAELASGELVGGIVTCGEYVRLIAVDRPARGQGIGTALLRDVEARLGGVFARVVAGAEPGNYFTPGIWSVDQRTLGFFSRHGYSVVADATNLRAPLDRTFAPSADPRIRRCSSTDRASVLEFVEKTFGPIWRFETERAFLNTPPTILVVRESEIIGFSAWCANNAALGTYGPAGIARNRRGQGLGSMLLIDTLAAMQQSGLRSALIQWAAAVPYYARVAGAEVAESFVVLEKQLQ